MSKFVIDETLMWWNVDHIVMVSEPEIFGAGWKMTLITVEREGARTLHFDNKDNAWEFFQSVTGYDEEVR